VRAALLSIYCPIMEAKRSQPGPTAGLTASELRLLPLLAEPQLSLHEISQILQMPRGVVVELGRSIYRKLGPVGEASRG
jgi:DNA-binding CsgD family transcriptional regulator